MRCKTEAMNMTSLLVVQGRAEARHCNTEVPIYGSTNSFAGVEVRSFPTVKISS